MIPFSELVQNFSSIKWNIIISSFYSFVFYLQKTQLEIVSFTILVAAMEATLILTGFLFIFYFQNLFLCFLWFWISVTNTCSIEVIPFVISLRFLECDSYCYCCCSCFGALQKLWPFSLPPDQYYLCANFCSEIFQLKLTEKRLM